MDHAEHGHAGNGTAMAMSMVFNLSTKVTILFSWWSTTTVTSYVFSLLFLFFLTLFNRFLGILKLQLDRRPINSDHDVSDVPKLKFPPSHWVRNRSSKDRMSPLPPHVEVNHDNSDCCGDLPSTPLLGPTLQPYSDQREQESYVASSHPRLLRPNRRCNWQQDITSSLLEGLRALIGYALMLSVMTYNVGILCAVLAGIVVGELLLGRFSTPSPGWQDGACHDG
ncbi:copper transporter crmD [Penicillium longicatenatum]|nr:copper transporter crmD [Penicillium longicatenatum]